MCCVCIWVFVCETKLWYNIESFRTSLLLVPIYLQSCFPIPMLCLICMTSWRQKAMGFRQTVEAFILKTLKMEVFCVGSRAIMEMPGKAERSKVGLDLVCLVCPVIPLQAAQIQIQIRIQKKDSSQIHIQDQRDLRWGWIWSVLSVRSFHCRQHKYKYKYKYEYKKKICRKYKYKYKFRET